MKQNLIFLTLLSLLILAQTQTTPVLEAYYPFGVLTASEGQLPKEDLVYSVSGATPSREHNQNYDLFKAYKLIEQGQHFTLDIPYLTNEFTLSIWSNFKNQYGYSPDGTILSINFSNPDWYGNIKSFDIQKNAIKINNEVKYTGPIGVNYTWNFVAVTYKQGVFEVSLNGLPIAKIIHNATLDWSSNNVSKLFIGSKDAAFTNTGEATQWFGAIADLRIHSNVLDIHQIRQIYDTTYQALNLEDPAIKLASYELNEGSLKESSNLFADLQINLNQSAPVTAQIYKSIDRQQSIDASIKFNQGGEKLYIPSNIANGKQELTFSFWFRTQKDAKNVKLFRIVNQANQEHFALTDTGYHIVNDTYTWNSGASPFIRTGSSQWQHIVLTFDLTNTKHWIFLNGNKINFDDYYLDNDKVFMSQLQYIELFNIADSNPDFGYFQLDDLKIYSKFFNAFNAHDIFSKPSSKSTLDLPYSTQALFKLSNDLSEESGKQEDIEFAPNYTKSTSEFVSESFEGRAIKAKSFSNLNPLYASLTSQRIDKVSVSYWVKNLDTTHSNQSFVKIYIEDATSITNEVIVYSDRVYGSDNTTLQKKTAYLATPLLKDSNWNHLSVFYNIEFQQLEIYLNGSLHETVTGFNYLPESSQTLKVQIGDQLTGNIFNVRIEDHFETGTEVLQRINFDKQYVGTELLVFQDLSLCHSHLSFLESEKVLINFSFPYENGDFQHNYDINFGNFELDPLCFVAKVTQGTTEIPLQASPPNPHQNGFKFPHSQAIALGCLQPTSTSYLCNFTLEILLNGEVQMIKTISSTLSTPDLTSVENGLSFQINVDNSSIVTNFDNTLQTNLDFCEDALCTTVSPDLILVRNQISYVRLQVVTDGYNQYYPVHQSLKIGTDEIVPENLSEIENWSQKGYIIYAIKPSFTLNTAMLSLQVSLVKDLPTIPAPAHRVLAEDSKTVGNYAQVSILEEDDPRILQKKQKFQDNEVVLYLGLGFLSFLSIVAVSVVVACYKLKKSSMKKSYQISQNDENLEKV